MLSTEDKLSMPLESIIGKDKPTQHKKGSYVSSSSSSSAGGGGGPIKQNRRSARKGKMAAAPYERKVSLNGGFGQEEEEDWMEGGGWMDGS